MHNIRSFTVIGFILLITGAAWGQMNPPGTGAKVSILSRTLIGTNDWMTNPGPPNGTDGPMAYIPVDNFPGTIPLYRLFNYNAGDHMDSATYGEGGYTTEMTLGYGFRDASGSKGLVSLERWYKSPGWHGTTHQGEVLDGFTREGTLGVWIYPRYGYARSDFHTVRNGLVSATELNAISAGGVTVESNAVWGGALAHWTWNGIQFINNIDSGRQMQTSIFVQQITNDLSNYPGYVPLGAPGYFVNPTEAGDQHQNGSPCSQLYNINTDTSSPSQITESIPLEWVPQRYGGSNDLPIVFKDMTIGKKITLNCKPDGIDRNWPVAEYQTTITMPCEVVSAPCQLPTGYLRANFNKFYQYDPVNTPKPVQVFPVPVFQGGQEVHFVPASGYGGVIIADSTNPDTCNAMGVFGLAEKAKKADGSNAGGPLYEFILRDHRWSDTPDTGEFAMDCTEWEANTQYITHPQGSRTYTTYVMTGTLNDIQRYMNTLYIITSGGLHPGWFFDTSANTEGWSNGGSLANFSVSGGLMKFDVSGYSAAVNGPNVFDINTRVNPCVKIRMKAYWSSTATLFWATPDQPYHTAERSVTFSTIGDNQTHDYVIDMSVNPQWTGTVGFLRVAPTSYANGHYEIDSVTFTPLPGDANRDGKVNFTDYLTLSQNFGATGMTWSQGDFTGDGIVNFGDYLLLSQNFGKGASLSDTDIARFKADSLSALADDVQDQENTADDDEATVPLHQTLPCLFLAMALMAAIGWALHTMTWSQHRTGP